MNSIVDSNLHDLIIVYLNVVFAHFSSYRMVCGVPLSARTEEATATVDSYNGKMY